jgi:hypothetical protein
MNISSCSQLGKKDGMIYLPPALYGYHVLDYPLLLQNWLVVFGAVASNVKTAT